MARRVILGAVVVVILATAIALLSRPTEPTYEGKTAGQWMDERPIVSLGSKTTFRRYTPIEREAKDALQYLGIDSVPAVISRLRCRDTAVRKFLIRIVAKQTIFKIR